MMLRIGAAIFCGIVLVTTGLMFESNFKLNRLNNTVSEMNERQKNVVVAQHKAIEDQIGRVCAR